MSETAAPVPAGKPRRRTSESTGWLWIVGLLVLFILFLLFKIPTPQDALPATRLDARMHSKEIAVVLYVYARNHGGNFPEGNSTTEIFQKLLDNDLVETPTIFYIPMPGKVRPERDQKTLKPENVCFDVTVPPDPRPAAPLPVVFLTGFKVNYTPGSAAVPAIQPHPTYGTPSWFTPAEINGIVVAYNNTKSKYLPWDADFSIPNFVPSDFKPEGQTYRQLTPDGPL